jgi:hypothetical protein
VKRTAVAEEPGTTIIAVGGTPGKAYEPHGWELWAPLQRAPSTRHVGATRRPRLWAAGTLDLQVEVAHSYSRARHVIMLPTVPLALRVARPAPAPLSRKRRHRLGLSSSSRRTG